MRHIKYYARLARSSVHKEQLTSYLINRNLMFTGLSTVSTHHRDLCKSILVLSVRVAQMPFPVVP